VSERLVSHYRVLEPIGRGGMGVVYEAEDTRLGRRVAIKLLPPEMATEAKAVARFLREGKAAATLTHPNICGVLDVGEDGGQPFLVMERLAGMTLRSAIGGRPMPPGRVLDLGVQMAEALEAAHAGGVVHRDVKPGNVFLTRDGAVKLTDFGLAKWVEPRTGEPRRDADTDTGAPLTREGAALGTVGYMSPEQARGEEVDARTDLFSLGAVLYEMVTGRPPFTGATDAVTFESILGRAPTRPQTLVPGVSPEVAAILDKALEKDRELRYQTAADLRADLLRARRARAGLGPRGERPDGVARGEAKPGGARWPRRAATSALLLAALALGAATSRALWPPMPPPKFTQLTFRRGIVLSARLTPDGHTVVYSALWDGASPEVFSRRLDNPASVALGLPPATLLAVSSRGELAILLAPAGERGVVWLGTLARVPLAGGPVRPVLEGVLDADWSPDGRELALVRWQDGQFQLEYPMGRVLLRPCPPTRVRVSPDGMHLALLDDEDGLLLLDRTGALARIRVARYRQRLAWSPRGDSVLVDAGEADLRRTLRRVTLRGEVREICALAGTMVVHDVSRDGRVLVHHGFERWDVRARLPGEAEEREASAFANSGVAGLSSDGSQVLLWHHGEGPPGLALLQPTRGGSALRIGDGRPLGLSADARQFVLERGEGAETRVNLLPTGVGEARRLDTGRLARFGKAWRIDETVVGLDAAEPGRPSRSFLTDAGGGAPRPVTPEGTVVVPGATPGGQVLARAANGAFAFYPSAGGEGEPVSWRLPSDPFLDAVRVSGDGLSLFVREGSVPARLGRIDLRTGQRVPWMKLGPQDATGVGHIWSVLLTPDGRGYAYTHGFFLQDLFLVEGLP
jgi:hypothetical protein